MKHNMIKGKVKYWILLFLALFLLVPIAWEISKIVIGILIILYALDKIFLSKKGDDNE